MPAFKSAPAQPVPLLLLPPVHTHISLWIAFEYILLFITLYISTIALSGIVHQAVDTYFKSDLGRFVSPALGLGSVSTAMLRGYLAAIIVSYPLFVIFFLHLKSQELASPIIKNLRSRKICIYFTLIVTFLITMGNITSTIYHFLEGTASLNSLMHLIASICIAGGVFFYYLWEVKEDRNIHA